MKRVLSLFLLLVCALRAVSIPAFADGASLNSDSSPIHSLAAYNSEVYCMTRSPFAEYSRVYCVTGGRVEEIYSDFAIDDIYSFSEGLLLVRTPERPDTLFNKMTDGNKYIEALDPETGAVTEWAHYPPESWPNHFVFTGGNSLFVRVVTDRNDTVTPSDDQYILQQYLAPGQSRTVAETADPCGEYPTFHPISIEKGVFFKNKIKLTLYDYETGAQHSTKSYLKLPDEYVSYSTLQAVLEDGKLWYLSKDALRIYDFSDDSDEVFLAFDEPSAAYHQFILSEDHIVLFGSDSHLIDVFGRSSRARLSRFTSSVSAIEYLLNDRILYLYSPYGSRDIECIDFASGAQTVIPLK